jgi:hypothetical protein
MATYLKTFLKENIKTPGREEKRHIGITIGITCHTCHQNVLANRFCVSRSGLSTRAVRDAALRIRWGAA